MSEQKLINANRKIHLYYYDEDLDEDVEEELTVDDFVKSRTGRRQPTILTIPDKPSNGIMLIAMYPDIEMMGESKDTIDYSLGGFIHRVLKSWWNAPYKMKSEDNNA